MGICEETNISLTSAQERSITQVCLPSCLNELISYIYVGRLTDESDSSVSSRAPFHSPPPGFTSVLIQT